MIEMRCRFHNSKDLVQRCDSGARLEVQEMRLSILDGSLDRLLGSGCSESYLSVQLWLGVLP